MLVLALVLMPWLLLLLLLLLLPRASAVVVALLSAGPVPLRCWAVARRSSAWA